MILLCIVLAVVAGFALFAWAEYTKLRNENREYCAFWGHNFITTKIGQWKCSRCNMRYEDYYHV